MNVYVFRYHAKPTKGSPHYEDIGGAYVGVYVLDENKKNAEKKAIAHLMEAAWMVVSSEKELVLNDELVLEYRINVRAMYERAKRVGIFSSFSAYPKEDRPDGFVEIRPVGKSSFGSSSEH